MDMEKRLIEYWRKNSLTKPGDTVIVACSGGPDSLALLDLLWQLQEELSVHVVAAHYEHGIRGAASKADADFVRTYCEGKSIPFCMEAGDIPAISQNTGESLETCARRMRYDFLNRVAAQYAGAVIATAHHADDQAETVLMHILRGSGIKGLGGILPKRDNIIRPLLFCTKADLVDYCHGQGLTPRLDATNNLADCTRNKIRLELLPILREQYNSHINDNLCNLAEMAGAEEELLQELCRRTADKLGIAPSEDEISCPVEGFLAQPLAMQRRLIQYMAQWLGITFSFVHIESLRQLIQRHATGTSINLPGDCQGRISYNVVYLSKKSSVLGANNATIKDTPLVIRLKAFSEVHLPRGGLISANLTDSLLAEGPFSKDCVYFDAAKCGTEVVIRYRKPGDKLRLPVGHKKLKDLLVDEKIPRDCRDNIPLVINKDTREIIWVAGVRQTAVALADENTKQYLILSYREKE